MRNYAAFFPLRDRRDGTTICMSNLGTLWVRVRGEGQEKPIGKLTVSPLGNRLEYVKVVDERRHLFENLDAWAVSSLLVGLLREFDAKIRYISSEFRYEIDASAIGRCVEKQYTGYEFQTMVPRRLWRKT